jgi:hypothetical protein
MADHPAATQKLGINRVINKHGHQHAVSAALFPSKGTEDAGSIYPFDQVRREQKEDHWPSANQRYILHCDDPTWERSQKGRTGSINMLNRCPEGNPSKPLPVLNYTTFPFHDDDAIERPGIDGIIIPPWICPGQKADR